MYTGIIAGAKIVLERVAWAACLATTRATTKRIAMRAGTLMGFKL